jgi:hypothetical protein
MSPSRRDFLISSTAAALMSSRILGANDRVPLGCIGYGLMGAQHVETFKRQPDADLAAVCDVYGRARQRASPPGLRSRSRPQMWATALWRMASTTSLMARSSA